MKIDKSGKGVFDRYFKNKPAFDDLEKAMYAYHYKNRDDNHAHSFYENLKSLNLNFASDSDKFSNEKCEWCGLTRTQIRWSDNPKCMARPIKSDWSIEETLKDEETSYLLLIERGESVISHTVNKKFGGKLTADALFYCQATLGYEPDIVSGIIDVDIEPLMVDYEILMKEHRQKTK